MPADAHGQQHLPDRHLRLQGHRLAKAPAVGGLPAAATGFTLSLAKQVVSGNMDEVIETAEHNVRLP